MPGCSGDWDFTRDTDQFAELSSHSYRSIGIIDQCLIQQWENCTRWPLAVGDWGGYWGMTHHIIIAPSGTDGHLWYNFILVGVPAYYFHANVWATSQHTFECPHFVGKYVVTWLEHSRECNRPLPGPLLEDLSIKYAFMHSILTLTQNRKSDSDKLSRWFSTIIILKSSFQSV